ncbi:Fe-S biogenesis protein NfuA [Microbulbifer thermotolerans]|uniref:Fe/S biogenesis protein NfuA n=1 Tax=Microbulbifer thermotolerans TaxID=252514 RepID=A0A143HL89_MICTH|nr:Fe-S biogenesis protein NfuA [Microbulbifer thermotolerans]AMX02458.1 Fe-S biogenesis protein NfuA [Microbulbifer thermotolerans]MCX2779308.1 Fe-S biogenesis protein NfuA [Microbulbifer thermotolerans]MCX2784481.1 Fe-S biogenesis protein NfuA [Microbulbifer thermotolerans]MCX2795073.1 Fe-S biogenesis protein NfuA [Microbulbifer thermotolerans]MCX2803181.1 Fe-S biogenesis protein NfuA [Microbulbifer thermotolerans]
MSELNVTITESAQEYLRELLEKQDCEGIAVRMFVSNPGTPNAETCIAYCRPGEEQEDDVVMEMNGFKAYFEARSVPYLDEARVDYSADKMGGQLTIRAPNSRMPKITDDSPIEDRINYVLYNDVNPGLAAHGGQVSLVEVTEDMFAVLRFGGGCQGCGMVDMTLKEGVEKTLKEKIPELAGVRDITDHSDKSQAYY